MAPVIAERVARVAAVNARLRSSARVPAAAACASARCQRRDSAGSIPIAITASALRAAPAASRKPSTAASFDAARCLRDAASPSRLSAASTMMQAAPTTP